MGGKYYHYSTGRYGLVDGFYRNIWLNVDSESIAHSIKKTFVSKLRLIVFDLTFFSNYTDQTVDSECCLHWHLPIVSSPKWSLVDSFVSPTIEFTNAQYPSNMLVEETLTGIYTEQQRLELQHQLLFYKKIAELLTLDSTLMKSVNDIFLIELSIKTIEEKIYQLAVDHLSVSPIDSAKLLAIVKKLYD